LANNTHSSYNTTSLQVKRAICNICIAPPKICVHVAIKQKRL
jgi:hypothetical protein